MSAKTPVPTITSTHLIDKSEDAKIKTLLLDQLKVDPDEAIIGWCHEGIRVQRLGTLVELSTCSFTMTGRTYEEAKANTVKEIRRRVEAGEQGC